jgi:hypothetical protein
MMPSANTIQAVACAHAVSTFQTAAVIHHFLNPGRGCIKRYVLTRKIQTLGDLHGGELAGERAGDRDGGVGGGGGLDEAPPR